MITKLIPIRINGKNRDFIQFETKMDNILGSIPSLSSIDISFKGQKNCFLFIEEVEDEGLCLGMATMATAIGIILN